MNKTKYIYILSQRYSGSTLLSFLLGTHPDIATIGERRKFYTHSFLPSSSHEQSCSCGKLFKECEHWNTIKERVLQRININEYTTNPTEFKLFKNKHLHKTAFEILKFSVFNRLPNLFSKKLGQLSSFNQILVEEIMHLDGGKAFLDSSKSIDHTFFLAQIPEFDFRIIWLTRDPRAQVNSAMKYNSWTTEEATNHWKKEMVDNAELLSKMNANYVQLNYEALCKNPQKEMVRLLDFLELDSSAFSLNFREQTQHIMGNYSMRLGKDTKIEERKEWKKELSENQISTIEEMTQAYKQYYSTSVDNI